MGLSKKISPDKFNLGEEIVKKGINPGPYYKIIIILSLSSVFLIFYNFLRDGGIFNFILTNWSRFGNFPTMDLLNLMLLGALGNLIAVILVSATNSKKFNPLNIVTGMAIFPIIFHTINAVFPFINSNPSLFSDLYTSARVMAYIFVFFLPVVVSFHLEFIRLIGQIGNGKQRKFYDSGGDKNPFFGKSGDKNNLMMSRGNLKNKLIMFLLFQFSIILSIFYPKMAIPANANISDFNNNLGSNSSGTNALLGSQSFTILGITGLLICVLIFYFGIKLVIEVRKLSDLNNVEDIKDQNNFPSDLNTNIILKKNYASRFLGYFTLKFFILFFMNASILFTFISVVHPEYVTGIILKLSPELYFFSEQMHLYFLIALSTSIFILIILITFIFGRVNKHYAEKKATIRKKLAYLFMEILISALLIALGLPWYYISADPSYLVISLIINTSIIYFVLNFQYLYLESFL